MSTLAALAGGFLANYFTLRRDREQWERQRQAERETLEREERRQALNSVREAYSACLRSLAEFRQLDSQDVTTLSEDEQKRHYVNLDAHFVSVKDALWALSINMEGMDGKALEQFRAKVKGVLDTWHAYIPQDLYEQVIELALSDPRVSAPALSTLPAPTSRLAERPARDGRQLP